MNEMVVKMSTKTLMNGSLEIFNVLNLGRTIDTHSKGQYIKILCSVNRPHAVRGK